MGAPAESIPSPPVARGAGLTPARRTDLRYAMLSVYYGSLGREMESTGAPAMLMPLGVRPLGLEEALDRIARGFSDHLRDAVWRVVRSVSPPRGPDGNAARYPAALRRVTTRDIGELDKKRWQYRRGSNTLAAALVACVRDQQDEFAQLRGLLKTSPPAMSQAMQQMLGMTAPEFLDSLTGDMAAAQLRRLESEVGLDLPGYAGEFADAAAFLEWWPPPLAAKMTIYPAACVIVQDSSTLVTTVTATSLVSCDDFDALARAVDPQCWDCSSDVITGSRYVRGCYDRRSLTPPEPGRNMDEGEIRFLSEDVTVSWGLDETQAGDFHNILRIDRFTVDDTKDAEKIDLDFSLARSIDSKILWDERPGGILVDQGFIKVRRMQADRWRVTNRKILLFSDRSPNVGGPGALDFGQMLNYLAPAAMSWWLESELSSAGDQIYSSPKLVRECVQRHAYGGADD